MLRYRRVNIQTDRDLLLEFHCRINYESESPWARTVPYERYREKWLSTSQPEAFISHLAETMEDSRTIAEIWEDGEGTAVGYLWVAFTEIQDYGITIAEVLDLAVAEGYQHRGIGRKMLEHIEELARERGAVLLRSDTGGENVASQKLHEKLGFKVYRIHYEKALRGSVTDHVKFD